MVSPRAHGSIHLLRMGGLTTGASLESMEPAKGPAVWSRGSRALLASHQTPPHRQQQLAPLGDWVACCTPAQQLRPSSPDRSPAHHSGQLHGHSWVDRGDAAL